MLDFRRDLNKKTKESIERRCTELWEQRRGAKTGNPLIKARERVSGCASGDAGLPPGAFRKMDASGVRWPARDASVPLCLRTQAFQTSVEALDATTQQMLRIMQAVAVQGGSKMKGIFDKTLQGWTAAEG